MENLEEIDTQSPEREDSMENYNEEGARHG